MLLLYAGSSFHTVEFQHDPKVSKSFPGLRSQNDGKTIEILETRLQVEEARQRMLLASAASTWLKNSGGWGFSQVPAS